MPNLEVGLQALSLGMLVLALIFTLGIIWRVEMELDVAYKIFFAALAFLFISKVSDLFVENEIISWVSQISNFLFALFLLAGIWTMRDLLRKMDGEK